MENSTICKWVSYWKRGIYIAMLDYRSVEYQWVTSPILLNMVSITWNLLINHLEKKMIFQASLSTCSMLIFQGCFKPRIFAKESSWQPLVSWTLPGSFGDFEDVPRIFVTGVQWSKYVDVCGICICYISFIYICEYKNKYVKTIIYQKQKNKNIIV